MQQPALINAIEVFFAKLPVGLRSKMFQYASQQGVRDEFASLGYQLQYCLSQVHSDLKVECLGLIKRHEECLKAERGVRQIST